MHPTLPAQLAAIAKEYGLPSTQGIVLYLVSSDPAAAGDLDAQGEGEEVGGRISEEVWKHVWTRVVLRERERDREDLGGMVQRTPSPLTLRGALGSNKGLGLGRSIPSGLNSSPSLSGDTRPQIGRAHV